MTLFGSQPFLAQESGTIRGTVQTSDQKPAAAVTVTVSGTRKAALTDDQGKFVLRNIPSGDQQIGISLVGHDKVTQAVTVLAGQTADVQVQLQVSENQLQEVIVTSRRNGYTSNKVSSSLRLNQDLIEVPQNIAITNSQTFRDLGAVSASELMRTAAGVVATGSKQDIGINIRGFGSSNSILRNGVGAGYWYNMEADPGMLERAEFISGPAGFMVSNTAPGGLANFVTKQPTHQQIATANFGFGSWNMIRTTLDLGGEFKKNGALTYRLNAGYQQQGTPYDFGYFKKYYAAAALKYEVDPRTELTFEYNYAYGRQLMDGYYMTTINGQPAPRKLAIVDPNVDGTASSDHYFRFHVRHKLNEHWNLNAQTAYVFGPWGGYNMGFSRYANDTLYRSVWMTDWDNRLFTAQAFLDGTFQTGKVEHKVLLGIDYGDNHTRSAGGGDYTDNPNLALYLPAPVYYLPKDSLRNFDTKQFESIWGNRYSALYLQYNAKLFEKLIVTLAGRYTTNVTFANYSDPYSQTDNRITPRLGLTYLLTRDISFYAMYDQAFVPQSGRSFTGQVFKPLTGDNMEIGFKSFWFGHKLSTNATAFKITQNNSLTGDPLHPGFSIQTGQIVSKGVEMNVNGYLTDNLSVMANYGYTDAVITKSTDSTLVGLPNYGNIKHNANLFAKYRLTSGLLRGLSFGAGLQYNGEVSFANSVFDKDEYMLPARTLLEASIGYQASKFYVNLNAYNLTNKWYLTSAYQLDETEYSYTPGDPINFRIDFGINF